jgi:OmpA-OmpF porin, OOP family
MNKAFLSSQSQQYTQPRKIMKKILASALLAIAALSTPAVAADFINSAPTTPFYAGVQAGLQDDIAKTIFGGFQFNKMFSAEVNYTSYNSYASSFGAHGLATFSNLIPAVPQLSFFGKAGVVRTTIEMPCISFFFSCIGGGKVTSIDPSIGGGAQYDFTKRFSVRAGVDANEYDSSFLYASGIVRF